MTSDDYLRLQDAGLTFREIADRAHVTRNAVAGAIWRAKRKRGNVIIQDDLTQRLDALERENAQLKAELEERTEEQEYLASLDNVFEIEGDAVIAGDIHNDTVHKEFKHRPLDIGREYLEKPRRFIAAGDFLSLEAFSGYEPTYPTPAFWREVRSATAFLELYLKTYDEIFILPGNHDLRATKKSHAALLMEHLVKIISHDPRIKVSNIGHMLLNTHKGTYRVTHGSEYSVNQLVVADQLAQKYRQHIIGWHQHHAALGMDRFKRQIIVDGGGLFDASAIPYLMVEDNKKPNMVNGFVMIKNGYPYLFNDHFTDWNFWLKASEQQARGAA
jgi:hypothetical protein